MGESNNASNRAPLFPGPVEEREREPNKLHSEAYSLERWRRVVERKRRGI